MSFSLDEHHYIALTASLTSHCITIDLRPYVPLLERHITANLIAGRYLLLPLDVPAHTILDSWLKLSAHAIVHGIFSPHADGGQTLQVQSSRGTEMLLSLLLGRLIIPTMRLPPTERRTPLDIYLAANRQKKSGAELVTTPGVFQVQCHQVETSRTTVGKCLLEICEE